MRVFRGEEGRLQAVGLGLLVGLSAGGAVKGAPDTGVPRGRAGEPRGAAPPGPAALKSVVQRKRPPRNLQFPSRDPISLPNKLLAIFFLWQAPGFPMSPENFLRKDLGFGDRESRMCGTAPPGLAVLVLFLPGVMEKL